MADAPGRAGKIAPRKSIKRPRKGIYTEALADRICTRLAEGESLRAICADAKMPDKATVFRWLADGRYLAFRERYAYAREAQMDHFADEILEIADSASRDVAIGADGKPRFDLQHIQRAKLRIDTRKWLMTKLAPKKYGDKLDVGGGMKLTLEQWLDSLPDE